MVRQLLVCLGGGEAVYGVSPSLIWEERAENQSAVPQVGCVTCHQKPGAF